MTSAAIQQTTPIINTKVSLRTYSVAVVKFMHEEEENVKTLQIIVSSSPLAPHPDVYLEVQHPCWSCNSNSSSANASAGVR